MCINTCVCLCVCVFMCVSVCILEEAAQEADLRAGKRHWRPRLLQSRQHLLAQRLNRQAPSCAHRRRPHGRGCGPTGQLEPRLLQLLQQLQQQQQYGAGQGLVAAKAKGVFFLFLFFFFPFVLSCLARGEGGVGVIEVRDGEVRRELSAGSRALLLACWHGPLQYKDTYIVV